MLDEFEITGRVRTHVTQFHEPTIAAQHEAGEAFLAMRAEAMRAGQHVPGAANACYGGGRSDLDSLGK